MKLLEGNIALVTNFFEMGIVKYERFWRELGAMDESLMLYMTPSNKMFHSNFFDLCSTFFKKITSKHDKFQCP